MDSTKPSRTHDRVLIVSSQKESTKLLENALQEEGFVVSESSSAKEALELIKRETPGIAIMNVSFINNESFEFLEKLRKESELPVIILSHEQNIDNKVRCLELGADNIIAKPYNNAELMAQIRALLRHTRIKYPPIDSKIHIDKLEIDFAAHCIRFLGHESKLSRKEYALLYELVLNAGNVLTFNYILQNVWGFQDEIAREYVHSYIKMLRSKIEPDPHNPQFIISLPGVGYMFRNVF